MSSASWPLAEERARVGEVLFCVMAIEGLHRPRFSAGNLLHPTLNCVSIDSPIQRVRMETPDDSVFRFESSKRRRPQPRCCKQAIVPSIWAGARPSERPPLTPWHLGTRLVHSRACRACSPPQTGGAIILPVVGPTTQPDAPLIEYIAFFCLQEARGKGGGRLTVGSGVHTVRTCI